MKVGYAWWWVCIVEPTLSETKAPIAAEEESKVRGTPVDLYTN